MNATLIRKELHQYIDMLDERLLSAVHQVVSLYLPLGDQFKRGEQVKACLEKLKELAALPANWDGEGASSVNKTVVKNTAQFIHSLPDKYIEILDTENIHPTPNGTVIIDWEKGEAFVVSIEIGKSKSGFFAELPDGYSVHNDNLSNNSKAPPKELLQALNKLYLVG